MSSNESPVHPSCSDFACSDECCRYGADVFPAEREQLLNEGLASPEEFIGPEVDEEGDLLYRTVVDGRGCKFLLEKRGCRLHAAGKKPLVCIIFPRNHDEAHASYMDGDLPCYPAMFSTVQS
jgi:hypothetical protein